MTKRKRRRIEWDRANWIFVKDSQGSIGMRYSRRLGLSRRLLQFLVSLEKENRQSTVRGLSLPGLPSNSFFELLQIFLWNVVHIVMQSGDYARSEGSE
jgi:hypothetical protein